MSHYPLLHPEPRHDADGNRLRQGGCSCGAVRFTVRGEPLLVGLCHCIECRKATGATVMAYADWPIAAFTVTGTARTHAGRSFCPTCGSRLFHLSSVRAEIMLGALDEAPTDLRPTCEGWIIRREHWLAPVAGTGQFERDPV